MLRLVARPLPVRDCHFHRITQAQIFIGGGRLRLAGRPLDSLNGLHTPPRPYHREYRARCLAASDKLTSCSTRWVFDDERRAGPMTPNMMAVLSARGLLQGRGSRCCTGQKHTIHPRPMPCLPIFACGACLRCRTGRRVEAWGLTARRRLSNENGVELDRIVHPARGRFHQKQ